MSKRSVLISVQFSQFSSVSKIQKMLNFFICMDVKLGADPELLLGGGANPGGGRPPNILVIFSERPYEIKEILVRRGGAGCAPLNPPLVKWLQ